MIRFILMISLVITSSTVMCSVRNECYTKKCPAKAQPYYTGAHCTPAGGCICVTAPNGE